MRKSFASRAGRKPGPAAMLSPVPSPPAPAGAEAGLAGAAFDPGVQTEAGAGDIAAPAPIGPPGPLRVVVVSHMHPRVSRGGAEIAAYQMYQTLRAMPDVRAWFVAASGGKVSAPLGAAVFQPFGPDEFVLGDAAYDHWSHSANNGEPGQGIPAAAGRAAARHHPFPPLRQHRRRGSAAHPAGAAERPDHRHASRIPGDLQPLRPDGEAAEPGACARNPPPGAAPNASPSAARTTSSSGSCT